ncbi:MAG: hypothetical protein AAGC47_04260, partial [Bacteroidota bacterium]
GVDGNTDLTYFELPTTVPEQLFFNVFINGRMSPYTRIVVDLITDTNEDGVYNENNDTGYALEFDPFYEGWRLESFRVSDFGISQAELEKFVAIQFTLISLNNLQPDPRLEVGFEMDYIVFTPLEPLSIE